jgi:SAM-dependent methyltransferase
MQSSPEQPAPVPAPTPPPSVQYFDSDFDAAAWIEECAHTPLLPITPTLDKEGHMGGVVDQVDEAAQWDSFFHTHSGGQFFKARKYVYPAFQKWIEQSELCLEVGCGHGCSIYPLLTNEHLSELRIIATDYSHEALSILMLHEKFDPARMQVRLWDISQPYTQSRQYPIVEECGDVCDALTPENTVSSILCLFVLSALHPENHEASLRHMWDILPPGGVILFRDYGVCDMTMFRHKVRLTEHLYRRCDGTLSYYFDLDYMRALCAATGFDPVELKYATVQITNKKKGITMKRVFVHAVLVKVI